VKGYYKYLIQHGTLHIYFYTQIIDFIFIGGLLLTLFFVHKLLDQVQPTIFWKNFAKKLKKFNEECNWINKSKILSSN
jgi:hypothetical protein